MRPFNVKLWGCIGLLAGLAIILGCGSGTDLLDEVGYRYQISVASVEDRNVATSDIDVFQTCDDVVTNGTEDEDSLIKAQVSLTFLSGEDQPDVWVYRIQIEYTLIERVGGDLSKTPNIPTNAYNVDIFVPGEGGTGSADVDLLTIADKEAYRLVVGNDDNGAATEAVFQVHVTAYLTYSPESPSNDLEITKNFTINVGNYEAASCTEETT